LQAANHPNDPSMGTRDVPFSQVLWIEADDFMEEAPRKFFRLRPDGEVRLRFAYIIRCDEVIKDDAGNVIELRCSYDPDTRSGSAASERKVKGTIHWVSAAHAVDVEARLYDRLFNVANPNSVEDFRNALNPGSLERVAAKVEPALAGAEPGASFQFERLGYFTPDSRDDRPGARVFNRIVTLRDSWAKLEQQALQGQG
jgi:glutaminyl-tRNA synthetase